jgi:thiamine-monophosphate kinase
LVSQPNGLDTPPNGRSCRFLVKPALPLPTTKLPYRKIGDIHVRRYDHHVTETDFLARLRPLATHPAARGLVDDAAVLGDLVFTHDLLVEGVHFLPTDPPSDVAWKLLAVNLSDLAAKGALPVGVLLGYPLGDDGWDCAFVVGLGEALAHFDVPLLGGDTVRGARVLSLTAIGRSATAPSRSGAQMGDALYVTGVIGRAGLGLGGDPEHVAVYRRPTPRLAEGQALAPHVHAMMDVSDGLLIDAQRMAAASSLALSIDLDAVPHAGEIMAAITAGDDYELLFAAAPDLPIPVPATRIGTFVEGTGLSLHNSTGAVAMPQRLGYTHG